MNNIRDNKSKSNLYASRNSVSRVYDDINEPASIKGSNKQDFGKYIDRLDAEPSLAYKKSHSPDLRSNIDSRASLLSEHSMPPSQQELE